ncbi:MAG: DUF2442 domain-containing protein [Candidatus Acidiferrales bacterium]
MKSALLGTHTSEVEVGNVSKHGFWLLVEGREYFLAFKEFPWFEQAPIGQLMSVKLLHSRHLYWPGLDIDLSLDSLEHPERFPLVSRWRPANQARRGGATRGSSPTPRRRKAW